MKISLAFILTFLLSTQITFAQFSSKRIELEKNFFIQNSGEKHDEDKQKVYYWTTMGNTVIYFLEDKLVFERFYSNNNKTNAYSRKKKKGTIISRKWSMGFGNPLSNQEIFPIEKQQYYYCTHISKELTTKSSTYKSIIYSNVWNNIDIEFYMHKSGGLKYNIILHPNANPDDIQFLYTGTNAFSLSENGEISIKVGDFDYVEKEPITYYDGSKKGITSSFLIQDNVVKFQLENYNQQEKIIIDPWLVDLIPENCAGLDLDYDNAGNVYVNCSSFAESELRKYDQNGILLWTYTIGNNGLAAISDVSVNKVTEEVYFAIGSHFPFAGELAAGKLDAAGNELIIYYYLDGEPEELWRMKYDNCNDRLIFGTGGSLYPFQGAYMEPTLTNVIGSNIMGAAEGNHDVNNLAIDPDGESCYMLIAGPDDGDLLSNILMKIPLPDLTAPIWDVFSTHSFYEFGSFFNASGGSFNGIACGLQYLYTYDGVLLNQWDKSDGTLVNSVTITNNALMSSGIDVTICGDIYIGLEGSVLVFDSNLTQINTIPIDGTVYDIVIGDNNKIYTSGASYIEEITIENPLNITFTADSCELGVGTALIPPCYNLDSLNILWTPSGAITAEATNLDEGWHTVNISYLSCNGLTTMVDSVFIPTTFDCTFNASLNSETICIGNCANLEVSTAAGTPPYLYQWGNGITIDDEGPIEVCPNITTTYSVIVTDGLGEIDTTFATITIIPFPEVDLGEDIIYCEASTITLDAQEPLYDFLWSDNSTNQTLDVSETGLYWVTVDNGGCTDTDSINISFVINDFNLGNDTILCLGQNLLIGATGYDIYNWSTGENTPFISVNQTGIYTALVTINSCEISDSIQVQFEQPIASFLTDNPSGCIPHITNFQDTSIGAIETWSWDFGNGLTSTDQNPTAVNYQSSGVYTVSLDVIDVYGCTDNETQPNYINAFPLPAAAFSFSPEVLITLNPVVDFVNETENIVSSFWQFGDGNTSIENSPTHEYAEEGLYIITLEVTNSDGCTNAISWSLLIEVPFLIYVPNSFTPNNDGINDFFKPVVSGLDPLKYTFEIYNRWGEVIFQTTDFRKGWNGNHDETSEFYAINGIYTWIITVKETNKSDVERIRGQVSVVR